MKQTWKAMVPPRVAFFGWEVCRESILTIDKLRARGQIIVNRCYLCMNESCKHLLRWCPIAYGLWSMIYELLRIDWVMVRSVYGEIWTWKGSSVKRNVVNLIPLTIFLGP